MGSQCAYLARVVLLRGVMKSHVATLALATTMVSLLQLAACKRSEDPVGTTSTTGVEIADPKADDQANRKDDLVLVQEVRQRLVADPTLSMRAKNIVVVVQDGVVTLRGPVVDEVEHDLVIAKIASIPGMQRVDDRLEYERK